MEPRERLIFPLDVPNKTEAERLISLLKHDVGLFKVGLELFVAEGPAFLKFLVETVRVEYFLDLKFHDIPATVARAQAQIKQGPRLTTVHVDQGPKMLKAMVASLKDGAKVLGVTVLTHLGPDDLEALGIAPRYAQDPSQLVLLRAGWPRRPAVTGWSAPARRPGPSKPPAGRSSWWSVRPSGRPGPQCRGMISGGS